MQIIMNMIFKNFIVVEYLFSFEVLHIKLKQQIKSRLIV